MTNEPKKLIEVALPIKEISAESVRDKSIRHGHISTLHLWWARRPLPVSRAVVFASLVPDPLDQHCPPQFRSAVEVLLAPEHKVFDHYKPYDDIPFTSIVDPMENNLRNRLLMFIGKFSDQFLANEKDGKSTTAKTQLSDHSLIKWDNKNNHKIIQIARKLIWVAHDPANNTIDEFDRCYGAVEAAQDRLYGMPDRHLDTPGIKNAEQELHAAVEAFLDRMPRVFDPFAGGGAIPLEAARLGCRTFANDINPVAHIIEKASLEFPQKYGKPIVYSKEEFIRLYGEEEFNKLSNEFQVVTAGQVTGAKIPNRLAFDVEFYARKLLKMTEEEIGHLYPPDENGNKPIAYYWARVATCANPACGAEVPLLKQFYLVNKKDKQIHLRPVINDKKIQFEIAKGKIDIEGWNVRGNLKCPCCGNTTGIKTVKEQFINGIVHEKMLAVIYDSENGKEYRLPRQDELELSLRIPKEIETFRPKESMQRHSAGGDMFSWGVCKWGQLFTKRQLTSIKTLIENSSKLKKEMNYFGNTYKNSVITYLGILIDRLSIVQTSYGRWDVGFEKIQSPFSRQSIPMMFDYPEGNIFSNLTGSFKSHLSWILRYIDSENVHPFVVTCSKASSGDINQFESKYLSAVVTDPPYYNAIAYADLSDFFYMWLKKSVGDIYPIIFATPQTPKTEECTALKHHHDNDIKKAKAHFETKLSQIFNAIEKQTDGIVSIMFAHQSTEAWTTLCNSILNASMNITSSWAIGTELGNRMVAMDTAALASSITVTCRPASRTGFGDYKTIKKAIERNVKDQVKFLYSLGFRGADLLTACFGSAVSEFGKYERVEKADGTEVTVAELLDMARQSAFCAIVSDIDTDEITRFYIGWLNLFGFSQTDHDSVRRITQIGLNIDIKDLLQHAVLIQDGKNEILAQRGQRVSGDSRRGLDPDGFLIDQVHHAMYLYSHGSRGQLVEFIAAHAASNEHQLWRVVNSLVEILPHGIQDFKEASGLLALKDNLIREAKTVAQKPAEQPSLFGDN